MSFYSIIFYFFYALAGLSAFGILFIKNIFKAALLLLICLLSLASIYVFAFAEFVAVTQIMIYAGGILVIIIFGIMLTTKLSGKALKVENAHIFSGILVSGALLFLLIKFFDGANWQKKESVLISQNAVTETGIELLSTFILPFELAGLLLLIALIGAAVITSSINKSKKI